MIQLLLFLFLINYSLMNGIQYDYDDNISGGMIKWIKRSNKDIRQYNNNENRNKNYLNVKGSSLNCLYDSIDISINIPNNIKNRGLIMFGIGYDNKEEILLTSIENIIDHEICSLNN